MYMNKTTFQVFFALLFMFVFAPQAVQAQEDTQVESEDLSGSDLSSGPATDSTDIMNVIKVFFDGLAEQDSVAMMSVTDPGARLVLTSSRADGSPLMRSIPMDDFVNLILSAEPGSLLETYWDPSIRVHDNLATVWISYNFYVGETLDHCGEDSIQLFRSGEGWKIIAIADTQRREGCEPEGE